MLPLQTRNAAFDLERKLVGLTIGTPAPVIEAVKTTLLVTLKYLVARDARYAELAAQPRHLLTFQQSGNKTQSLIHRSTLLPRHSGLPQMRDV